MIGSQSTCGAVMIHFLTAFWQQSKPFGDNLLLTIRTFPSLHKSMYCTTLILSLVLYWSKAYTAAQEAMLSSLSPAAAATTAASATATPAATAAPAATSPAAAPAAAGATAAAATPWPAATASSPTTAAAL